MKNKIKVHISAALLIVLFGVNILNISNTYAANKADYKIERIDKSVKDNKGQVLAKLYCDKVVLQGNSKVIRKINQSIERYCHQFFDEHEKNFLGYVENDLKNKNPHTPKPTPEYPYYCTSKAKVTYNRGGIVSICNQFDWLAGGVGNRECKGLTYQIKNGKQLTLTDVVKGNNKSVKQKVVKHMAKKLSNVWEYETAMNAVKAHTADNYEFYLKGSKVYICFGCYELGLGNGDFVTAMSRK